MTEPPNPHGYTAPKSAAQPGPPLTQAQFDALTPYQRGYAVYMLGSRSDEPNVPEEKCPYPAGSPDAAEWDSGQFQAMLTAQDSEE